MNKTILTSLLALVLAAGVLLGLSLGLAGVAEANAQAENQRVMEALLPGSTTFQPEAYAGEDATIRSVCKGETGFVIETVTAGYADELSMLVGVDSDGTVTGVVVTRIHETPGLGSKALTDWEFLGQFLYRDEAVTVGTDVDALTGATVTSKAVARCVNAAIAYVTGADAESGATSWGG